MNIPRAFTALAEWSACLSYIFLLGRKYHGIKFALLLPVTLLTLGTYQQALADLPLYFWLPGMVGALLLMYFFIYFTTEASWKDTAFCCIRAFILAEFTASFHWHLYAWFANYLGKMNEILSGLTRIPIYSAVILIYFFLEKRHLPKDTPLNVSYSELLSTGLTALCIFTLSNISFITPNTPFSGLDGSILYERTLVDFAGLVMLYVQQDRRESLRLKMENQSMNAILHRQYDQYRLALDNTELLRREFHDLKHYMIAIRSAQSPDQKEQYLAKMEEGILTQEALSNTGNSVLDVILTTKSIYCIQNNIHFTCMANGSLLSFIHVKDICSIFGNALDNAIECVSMYEDKEKRIISLVVSRRNNFLVILCENYSENTIIRNKDQLPVTTKKDSLNHGYGLKSIRSTVAKYNGTMHLQAENHWFRLQILIPIN